MMYVQALPPLSCGQAFKNCFNKFCNCSGRARRSEFWYFVITCIIIMIIPIKLLSKSSVDSVPNETYYTRNLFNYSNNRIYKYFIGMCIIICVIALIEIILMIPLISVSIRRLHDTGRSGYYFLLNFIPFGSIVLLIFFVEDSKRNLNEYGPSPKYILIQSGSLVANSQINSIEGMVAPNYNYTQGYPEVAPPYQQFPQYPQVNIQPNLYQDSNQSFPQNQDLLVNHVASP